MRKFKVVITETVVRIATIEADCLSTAIEKGYDGNWDDSDCEGYRVLDRTVDRPSYHGLTDYNESE